MATSSKAPKQWTLSEDETLNSFDNWKEKFDIHFIIGQNLYCSLECQMEEGINPQQGILIPKRGFEDNSTLVEAADRKAVEQKLIQLNMMLGQIVNFVTEIL